MNPVKLVISAAFACGFVALAPNTASAMPVANVGLGLAPITEDVHAVRVCNRWGRCWLSAGGHYHGYRYGWRRPYYGYRPGWRHYGGRGGRYGYGWHGGRGGWDGGRGGWHGGRGHWR